MKQEVITTHITTVEKRDSSLQQTLIQNKQGQSTIEFLVTFSMCITVIFVFVKIAFNAANGFLIHYSTFMASRMYYTWDNHSKTMSAVDSASRSRSLQYFNTDLLPGITLQEKDIDGPDDNPNKVFIGMRTIRKDQFGISEVIGGKKDIFYVSEAYLGKSPPWVECGTRTCRAVNEARGESSDSCPHSEIHSTLFDNGC